MVRPERFELEATGGREQSGSPLPEIPSQAKDLDFDAPGEIRTSDLLVRQKSSERRATRSCLAEHCPISVILSFFGFKFCHF